MQKVYILDTNTLIENPDCLEAFRNGQENKVLIPYSVIMELDRLKTRPDLTHIIALVADRLEHDRDFSVIHIPTKTYSVSKTNDDDILEDIRYAFANAQEYFGALEPVVVSNDRMFRVRLNCEGIKCQEYKDSKPFQSLSQHYTGFVGHEDEKIANCFWWDHQNKLWFEGTGVQIDYEHNPWGVKPRNIYQNCAMELMLCRHIDVVTLQSEAGFGKSHIALACAFELALQKPKEYGKIFIFKPVVEIGERLGFLPGDEKEKLAPYMRGITVPDHETAWTASGKCAVHRPQGLQTGTEPEKDRDHQPELHPRDEHRGRHRHHRRGTEHHPVRDTRIADPHGRTCEMFRPGRHQPGGPPLSQCIQQRT